MTRSTGIIEARRALRELNIHRCGRCKRSRHASDFHKLSTARWGLQSSCKDCAAEIQRAADARVREAKRAKLALVDKSVKTCGTCSQSLPVDNFRLRTEKGREHQRYSTCNACWKARGRAWMDANPERVRQKRKEWLAKDPARTREIYRACQKRRLADPAKRLHARVSNQVWQSLRGLKSGRATESLLGYTFAELRAHLERQFVKGMGWHNMGEWHVDHIVPLASFAIAGPECPEFKRAWALTNLRPLWAAENIAKRDKRTHLI